MLTSQEIWTEYAKCITDPKYVIETYLETFDKTQNDGQGANIPFKLFPRQSEIVDAYERFKHNIITKPRQAGVSTTTAAYLTVKAAFADTQSPESILIIANKQALAIEFLGKIKEFLTQIPRWVWGGDYYGNPKNEARTIFIKDSEKEIKLPNGSRVKAVATSKDALRGFTPTYLVMDEAAYIENGNEVFTAAQTSLGCLTKETLILTDNGLVQLDELVKEKEKLGFTDLDTPINVCNKNGEITQATQTFVSEYGKTYRIKTKLGLELEGSWKHPILIDKDGEEVWVKMNELKIGDKPIIQYNQNLFGKESKFESNYIPYRNNNKKTNIPINLEDNIDFVYLLGLFVAEGNFLESGITITNVDDYITNFLTNDIAKLGNGFRKIDDRHYMFYSAELVTWFKNFGLKKHNAKLKEIPLALLKMPKNVIKAFLQGMFDGDGMSSEKGIKYHSTSKKLIKTLQTLLLNFGIISHIQYHEQKTSESSVVTNKDHVCKIYTLSAYSDYAIKFYDEIGFRLERKQKNKILLLNKKNNSRFVNISQNEILDILKLNNLNPYASKLKFLRHFLFVSKYDRLSYDSYFKLLELFPNNDKLLKLSNQIIKSKNFYIDEIVGIEESKDYTYDLHVPVTNSFISNGIISHNTGGRSMLISTPRGMDELYYKTYQQAKAKKNGFNVIEMKWYEDLRYNKGLKWIKKIDDNKTEEIVEYEFTFESYEKKIKDGFKPWSPWYDGMCRNMNNDARMIAQELDVSFIGSAGNVIDEKFIEFQETHNVKEPKYIKGSDNEIWVWEEPIVGHQYIAAVDVSRGDGSDSSTIVIIDFTTMEQVMEYQGKVPPDLLAYIVKEWSDRYSAYVVVDITGGMGVGTVRKLIELGCTRLHYDKAHNPALVEFARENGETPGFTINSVRTPMIAHLEHYVRENMIKIRSQRLTSEMKTFVFKNHKADHMTGYHDDLLMALAMGLWVLEHSFKNLERVNEQTKAMLNAFIGYDPLKGKPIDQPKVANPFLKQTKQNRIGGSNILWIPPRS